MQTWIFEDESINQVADALFDECASIAWFGLGMDKALAVSRVVRVPRGWAGLGTLACILWAVDRKETGIEIGESYARARSFSRRDGNQGRIRARSQGSEQPCVWLSKVSSRRECAA